MAQAKAPEINLTEVLKQVAHEKDIDLDRWISALEDAVASAAKKQHRIKEPVRAKMDRETGQFEAFIVKTVVEEVEDPHAEWTLEEAREHEDGAEIGDEILRPLSTEGLGRIAAQSAKQVLYQRVREAEREKIYNEYIDRVGDIVNGTVRRFERGDIIVDLGRTEAVVPRSEQSRHERYSQGERIRAVIVDVHTQPKGQQVVLSRTDPRLLMKLFEMEVPEIYDGTVVIKTAVRAPGERAKVAVQSRERDVDPVGACVGMKGSRVQSIIRELRGEKIDIIEYSEDLVTFAQSALAPARITRVAVNSTGDVPHLDVIVEDEQLSLAIGKRGQNVRLASELIGARIEIKSETDVKDEVADALAKMLHIGGPDSQEADFSQAPDLDQAQADALRAAGYETYESVAQSSVGELTKVEGLDMLTAAGLIDWATDRMEEEEEAARSAAGSEEEESEADSGDDGELDFMAALSKAFQEAEQEAAAEKAAVESAIGESEDSTDDDGADEAGEHGDAEDGENGEDGDGAEETDEEGEK
ncbi:MAG: transcription termination factor NusA [Acidobacteria bacterium]|nr:MAG: transcription termination factor NusA [Acidobacteriota bacterium]REK00200.1 MAG: transcription termination factor NusA [Acidobacteriota bacterium]